MAIEAGRVLNQRYRLIRPVGQGSQASVWVAEHLALQTHVAVKLIDPELAKKESARERFRREATAAAQLRSAHVVQILDHGIDDDQPFIVMELLDGEDLFERLAHRSRLSLRETSKIVTQVARALIRAHAAGIVHRDLKPENVFLCPNEDDEVVKVLDFGVAKVKDAAKVTMQKTGVGTLIGTPHYMSPEQVKGIGEIDHRADLWALGVIAFQCVTGELPFDSEGVGDLLIKITIGDAPIPSRVYPGVPANFDVWFAKACAREPAKRFQSAREMAVALAGVVGVVDGLVARSPTVRPPAASLPALAASTPIPRAPRAATEQLDIGDWEEVAPFDEDEDNAATVAGAPAPLPPRPAPAPAPPARSTTPASSRPASSRPPVPNRPKPTPHEGGMPAAKAPLPKAPAPAKATPPAQEEPRGPPVPRAPAPRAAMESHESHDIVDFDETIPVTDNRPSFVLPLLVRAHASPEKPTLTPLSEPPRAPVPAEAPPAPESKPPEPISRPSALIAPVVAMPARQALMPPPSNDAPPPSIPRPPPSSRNLAGPPSASRPSPAPVVKPLEVTPRSPFLTEPPPELDGSKRRRMVRFMVACLVLFAVGITWTVVRSQLDPSPGASTPPAVTSTPAPPEPPPPPPVTNTPTPVAVDPGKVSHPSKPTPTVHRGPLKPIKPRPSTDDTTIRVPDPPPEDDSVQTAP